MFAWRTKLLLQKRPCSILITDCKTSTEKNPRSSFKPLRGSKTEAMLTPIEIIFLGLPIVLQIVLTYMRLQNKIKIPIWLIFIFVLTIGVIISFYLSNKLQNLYRDTDTHQQCGPGIGLSTLIPSLFWTIISTSIIGLIGGLLYRDKQKQKRQLQEKYE